MSDNVLYFPQIRVPESAWFTRMLLYWDKVGTIIPEEFLREPDKLGEPTRSLLIEEMLFPVMPGNWIYQISDFDRAFGEYLERLSVEELDYRRRNLDAGKISRIHVEKVQTLEDVLQQFGLGQPSEEYTPWYDVERKTAADFMAYLAASLGRLDDLDSIPITDRQEYCEPLTRQIDLPVQHKEDLTMLRLETLENLLPGPKKPISAEQIRNFRKSHGALLGDFRRRVEREIVYAAAIPDPDLRQRRLQLFQEEIQNEVMEIEAKMNESRFGEIVFSKLMSIVAVIPGVPFVFGIASAVYNAFRQEPQNEVPSPLAYAAYAQIELLR
jgi:hypothetical protein